MGAPRYSPAVRFRSISFLLLAALLLTGAGCPKSSRRTLVMPEVPTTGDPDARARFQEARTRFERDGVDATGEFEAIAEAYPDDPVAAYARLYAGMSAVRSGNYQVALDDLEKLDLEPGVDAALRARGALYLGLAHNYLGQHRQALPALERGEPAIQDEAERGEWLAAMAVAKGQSDQPLAALPHFDAWYALASPAEKVFIVSALESVVRAADAPAARRAYQELDSRDAPSAAVLGARVANDLAAAGDLTLAESVRAETARAREQIGYLAGRPGSGVAGDPERVGALVPLTGKSWRVGALAVRGLALVAGTFDGAGGSAGAPRPFDLSVRDTRSTAAAAAEGAAALAASGVIAVLGPLDADATDAVAEVADREALPVLSLDPIAGRGPAAQSPYIFQVRHSAEERARALARWAHARGVRDVAILRPDNGYGRAVAAAFRAETERLGAQVVVEATYDPGATSFGSAVKKLRKPFGALFVPDMANRLELVAPALAQANLISAPIDAKKPKHGRKILLLSTAEALTSSYLRGSGRYSLGAVLAPGFYPDREHPLIGDFVDRYEQAVGRAPTVYEAYAYDAALAVRAAVEAGAATRSELAGALLSQRVRGLTGTVSFDSGRRRADDGRLFTVVQTEAGDFAIRALD